jgi:HlyD family secretion protein
MKKIYLYIIIGVVVVGTGGYFLLSGSGTKESKYRTEKVTRGGFSFRCAQPVQINPVKTVRSETRSRESFRRSMDFNSIVKEGEVIATIDATLLAASVKEAQANLSRNQATINQAERDFKRASDLFAKELVSQSDLDAAKTAYETAKAQVMQTEAALDRAKVNLKYAVIRSPIDGVVISRDVDVGQTVAASLQTPKLFSIANDLKSMQVEASVDEADIGQIKVDQTVTFTVDAYPEEQFRGRVAQIRLAPVTVQNVVTYTVVIEVPNQDLKLRPGMTATVSILIDKRDDALRVPTLALRFQPPPEVLEKIAATPETPSDAQASPSFRPIPYVQGDGRWRKASRGKTIRSGGGPAKRGEPGEQRVGEWWRHRWPRHARPEKILKGVDSQRRQRSGTVARRDRAQR